MKSNNNEVKYEILNHIAVLSTSPKGWTTELNLISWNGGEPKFDIRDWGPKRSKVGKGIVLDEDEFARLMAAGNVFFGADPVEPEDEEPEDEEPEDEEPEDEEPEDEEPEDEEPEDEEPEDEEPEDEEPEDEEPEDEEPEDEEPEDEEPEPATQNSLSAAMAALFK